MTTAPVPALELVGAGLAEAVFQILLHCVAEAVQQILLHFVAEDEGFEPSMRD